MLKKLIAWMLSLIEKLFKNNVAIASQNSSESYSKIKILGASTRDAVSLNKWLKSKNCPEYAEFYEKYGKKYGVRWDIAIFQSCLETGFWSFKGDVSRDQNNFAGIGATGGGVKGDSFASPEQGIHAQIQNLALRAGVKIPKEEIIAPYVRKNYETIANRGSVYWEDLTGTYAADKQYHIKIYNIAKEFDTWLASQPQPKNEEQPPMTQKSVNWFEMYRNDKQKPTVIAYNNSTPVAILESEIGITIEQLYKFAQELGAEKRTFQVAPAGKAIPVVNSQQGNQQPKKRVLLDPGHSEKHVGARGKNPNVQEEDLNRYQAQCLKKELEALGIIADIYDPIDDDLVEIGKKAQDYDAFVSLHLNACNKKEHYTCVMVHPKYQRPDSLSAKVASEWAIECASAINNPVFAGSAGYPKGVMATGLSVLSGAAQTNCPIYFLSELEFVDDETDDAGIKARIEKGMKAGARVLAKYLK